MRKRFLGMIISTLMMILMLGLCANAETITGSCGDNATYSFDTETGVLNISGTGEINHLGSHNAKQINISEGITSIGKSTFWGYSNLASISIPNSVTAIGDYAFSGCSSLTSISIPNGVTTIGESAFWKCSSLKSISIPNTITTIGESAFRDCNNLTSISIPNSVMSIGKSAFRDCSSLTSISIPNSVTSIGESAFQDCSSLKSISIANGVTNIGTRAFSDCINLTRISIPNSVTSIGMDAFWGCSSLTSITIPGSIKTIESMAFYGCSSLTSIDIQNGVKTIGMGAFNNCSSLKSISIPNSVTIFESGAFAMCSNLTSISIPNSVMSIGEYVFNSCTSLTSITIPNSVTSIGDKAFDNCNSLATIYGYDNSEAQRYAKEHNINFVSLGATYIDDTKIKQFVNRLYSILLDRDADADGLNNWSNKLVLGSANAAQIVEGLANSDEFNNKNLSHADVVERMYKAMLGRESDEGGKKNWTNKLDSGLSVNSIINGFSGSAEFGKICSDYGIQPGSISLNDPCDQNEGVSAFVARCYEKALGRVYEKNGINNWCKEILNAPDKKKRAEEVASDGFFHSQEFVNKNTSNEEYTDILYKTFLGREADEAGKADWVGKLNSGVSRDDVLYGFSRSAEFANIMAQYGL